MPLSNPKKRRWRLGVLVLCLGFLSVMLTLPVHAQQTLAQNAPASYWDQVKAAAQAGLDALWNASAFGLIGGVATNTGVGLMLQIIGWFIDIYSYIIEFIIQISLNALAPLITAGSFITHPFVTEGWPFIQGIANIGFILVLLFIALAQTLHLDNYPVRRLLPRLLLAALLINFSLVISGVLIDTSRLLMAMMINILIPGGVNNLQGEIINSSELLNLRIAVSTQVAQKIALDPALVAVTAKLITAFLDTIFAIGIVVVVVGFLIRYIMLLLLLIVSPLAYLGSVLPNTANLARRWWALFLKYVLYGPAALFLLLLAHQTGNLFKVQAPNQFNGLQVATEGALSLVVTTGLLFAAAKAGSFLGVAGSAAVMGWATSTAKRGARAYVSPVTNFARNNARDIGKGISSRARDAAKNNGIAKWVVPAKRDDKGNLKPGEQSLGSRLIGQARYFGKKGEQYKAAKALGPITSTNVTQAAISAPLLSKGHVTEALGNKGVEKVAEYGTSTQIKALLKNADYLRQLNPADRASLQKAIMDNKGLSANASEQSKILDRLVDALDKVDNP